MTYNDFLEIMKNGWKGTIESNNIELPNPSISTMYSRIRRNPFDALGVQELAKKINATFKVHNNGITVQLNNIKNININWENIIRISDTDFRGPYLLDREILIKMKDGTEILISPPFKKYFIFKHYFVDEFISYVSEHVCAEPQKD
jgi:hypothetical protein